jgi:hypothetical protein
VLSIARRYRLLRSSVPDYRSSLETDITRRYRLFLTLLDHRVTQPSHGCDPALVPQYAFSYKYSTCILDTRPALCLTKNSHYKHKHHALHRCLHRCRHPGCRQYPDSRCQSSGGKDSQVRDLPVPVRRRAVMLLRMNLSKWFVQSGTEVLKSELMPHYQIYIPTDLRERRGLVCLTNSE